MVTCCGSMATDSRMDVHQPDDRSVIRTRIEPGTIRSVLVSRIEATNAHPSRT